MKTSLKQMAIPVCTALFVLATYANAAVVISDSFSLNGTNREVGDPLTGTLTETGGETWSANARYVFAGNASNGYATLNANGASGFGVPFVFSEFRSLGNEATLTVSAKISGQSWLGINFGRIAATGTDFLGNTKLWVLQTPTGAWFIRNGWNGGTEDILASGTASFTSTDFATFSLTYDETTSALLDYSVNGVPQLSSPITFTSIRTWSVDAATAFVQGGTTSFEADSFTLAVVPESKTALLVAVGCGLVVLRMRRKTRGTHLS